MKKTALITGATSGIGEATSTLLAQNNFNLIITGRRNERLNALKEKIENETDSKVHVLNFDIRNQQETEKAIQSLPEEWQTVDVLINNAGLAAGLSGIDNGNVDDWERMIDTNIKGLLYISRLVSARMIEKGEGHIVNISSIAGRETYPMGNVYCATKHAVQAITKGMRLDFLKHGIKVSSVSPGAVETEFSLVRFAGDSERANKVYEGITPLAAKDIADTILFVVTRPKHVNIDDILVMPTDQAFSRDFNRKA
ncbi:NADP-dependent 3-hydroxy acid dehydrogenase YdfG [Mariniphaga anaerophila]|uniref:NADP-dependent 3-hydroxy acid dehydrogenase YdfG n=1 Tax=Mariniphaga anaerophila TaxID=1484053 RepID=A0A1M5DAV8_9BACT|nr:SDR family NAD(P)-dependent oxidoreductase [Mariniphaga anaerophila]SHF63832.1 NADP-dependent 3-hydroxy acid dehydrogenase YdfG [Mariniphaga anaerophila]